MSRTSAGFGGLAALRASLPAGAAPTPTPPRRRLPALAVRGGLVLPAGWRAVVHEEPPRGFTPPTRWVGVIDAEGAEVYATPEVAEGPFRDLIAGRPIPKRSLRDLAASAWRLFFAGAAPRPRGLPLPERVPGPLADRPEWIAALRAAGEGRLADIAQADAAAHAAEMAARAWEARARGIIREWEHCSFSREGVGGAAALRLALGALAAAIDSEPDRRAAFEAGRSGLSREEAEEAARAAIEATTRAAIVARGEDPDARVLVRRRREEVVESSFYGFDDVDVIVHEWTEDRGTKLDVALRERGWTPFPSEAFALGLAERAFA